MKQVTSSIRFENIFRIFIFSFTCFLSILTDVHGAQLIQDCRSGGKGTLQECQQRDAKTAQKATQTTSPQCWLLPGGGSISAHSNSTPPITGARLGKCPNSETKSITAKQAQPSNTKTIEKNIDCRSGGRGTAQECQQRDAQAQAQAQAQSKARAAEKTFDCRSGGRGTAQECQQRDAQTQAQSKASTAEKTFDCRSGGRGTAQECQQRDAQADAKTKALNAEKRIDCRSGGRGTSQECQLRDAQAQSQAQAQTNNRPTEKISDCRSGGRGTAQECQQRDAQAQTQSNARAAEKIYDCRSGGRGTAQECQLRDAQTQAQSKERTTEKTFDCRSGGRGTAQECQQRDAQEQGQSNARTAEKTFDCRSGGRGTAKECVARDRESQSQTQPNSRSVEKTFDCRNGGRGTAQECLQRDARAKDQEQSQALSNNRAAEKTFECRSGGIGTANECVERDNLATQRAPQTASQQCWLFPNGGNTIAHANSTPPVSGARLGKCPINETMPIQAAQSQPSTRTAEKIYDCRSGGRGTAKECVERDNLATQRASQTVSQQCWLFPNGGNTLAHANSTPPVAGARLGACPFNKQIATQTAQTTPQLDNQTTVKTYDCRSGGRGTAQECQQRDREAQEQISNRNNEKTYTCNSGGRGTAKECIERDKLEGQIPIQSNSQKCWLLPDGGTIVAHPNSTPPVSGARLSACSNSSSNIALMPTQKVKASPLLSGQIVEKTNECKSGSSGSSKECKESNEITKQKSTMTSTTCWLLPSGGYIETNVSSTPPVAGAKPGICPNKVNMPIQVTQSQSNKQSLEPTVKTTTIQNTNFVYPLENKKTAIHHEGAFYDPAYNNRVVNKKDWRQHLGIDFLAPGGSKVYAMKAGKILRCGYTQEDPMKKAILVQNVDGTTSIYGHIDPTIRSNSVKAGEELGTVIKSTLEIKFPEHLHLGENSNTLNCDVITRSNGDWGWGRAPYKKEVDIEEAKKEAKKYGWIDPATKYGFSK